MFSYFVYGHNAFYILFSIHLIFLFLAYILIFHFIHLYYCTVWIFMFLWHSTPAYLLYFICIVFLIFALMAGIISYVCAFPCMYILFTPFTCVIDQTGCRRDNGAEPVIASARCLTARSLPTIPWIFSLRRNQRSSTTPLAQPPSTASPPCPASFTPGESFSYTTLSI